MRKSQPPKKDRQHNGQKDRQHNGQKKDRQHNGQKKDRQHNGQKKDRQHNGQNKDRQHNGQKKDRQHNGQKKNGKKTNNSLQNIHVKSKDWVNVANFFIRLFAIFHPRKERSSHTRERERERDIPTSLISPCERTFYSSILITPLVSSSSSLAS